MEPEMKHSRLVRAALAVVLACALACPATFAYAAASDAGAADTAAACESTAVIDKADYYEQADDGADGSADGALSTLATYSVTPKSLSDDMKYFAYYESGGDYDAGLSSGDGYHAVGFYQFDHRYTLYGFLIACYNYDSSTYSMFKQFKSVSESDFTASDAMRSNGSFTTLGTAVNKAWHAAYAADPDGFARLQDGWAYANYYEVAENYLEGRGISLSSRPDCIKGLCWGLCNLFGSGGWRRFVGGTLNGTTYAGCGLSDSMSDYEFANTLCTYVIDNVSTFYPNSSAYWKGWQNRYTNELNDVLEMLGPLSDVATGKWYTKGVNYVVNAGLMTGYSSFPYLFGVGNTLTRAELAMIMWRIAEPDEAAAYVAKGTKNTTGMTDVESGKWYTGAANWAVANGVINGYENADGTRTKFGPSNTATFEQFCQVLANYATGGDVTASVSSLASFTDVDDVSEWAELAMAWAVEAGIVSGYKNADGTRTLASGEYVARERAAVVFMNACKASVL